MRKPVFLAHGADKPIAEKNLREFLRETHPGVTVLISDLVRSWSIHSTGTISPPEVRIYCPNKDCEREQNFSPNSNAQFSEGIANEFLSFTCKNCGKFRKTFALILDT
jgi:hypothetical protein